MVKVHRVQCGVGEWGENSQHQHTGKCELPGGVEGGTACGNSGDYCCDDKEGPNTNPKQHLVADPQKPVSLAETRTSLNAALKKAAGWKPAAPAKKGAKKAKAAAAAKRAKPRKPAKKR